MSRHARNIVAEVWLGLVLIGAWFLVSRNSTSVFFPPLGDILTTFRELWLFDYFRLHAVPSIINLVAGFTLASVLGIALGVVLGLVPTARDIASPVLEFMRALPGVAILPIALLVLGLGSGMKISVIAFGAFWPILLNTIDGVRSLEPVVRDVIDSYKIRFWDALRYVLLPNAAPQIFAGMRIGLAISFVLVVVSEMIATSAGIGYFILLSQREFSITEMWTGIILFGILGYLANLVFRAVERGVLKWQHERSQTLQGQ